MALEARNSAPPSSLMQSGQAYVKISGYRSSVKGYPYDDVAPMARGYIEAAPDRCVWGTRLAASEPVR